MSALLSFGKVGSSSDDGSDAEKTITEIVNAGKHVLELNVTIYTRELTDNIRRNLGISYSTYAFVTGGNGCYVIYIRPGIRGNRLVEIIAHELVHVQQIESGRLKIAKGEVMYNDRKYWNPKDIFYSDREWEDEAFRRQHKVRRLILTTLSDEDRKDDDGMHGNSVRIHAVAY